MPKLNWSPSLSLGVKSLDRQHQELIDIANKVIEAVEQEQGQDAVRSVIQSLREYTVHHFHDEEEQMKAVRYPKRADHAALHAELVRSVKDFQYRIYIKEVVSGAQVKAFLKGWLLEHILNEDLDFGRYVQSVNALADQGD
ncbi:bacteriohemerythrin [Desulfovibrio ferrophilus]|uniref:Hemerythrin-like metal-binding protein n=1 Tax=Desulfovibrio ferrophilus TaxID=241368 RepID=A0A2Z6B282_9BACT|nr:bacteriohemerythrin [Desulfovibrio ferrophilus]BBD09548.1 hemerythrin-like metal-binding protein [Desulfovibrio ferrophilus]